jgi:hypothetical protein
MAVAEALAHGGDSIHWRSELRSSAFAGAVGPNARYTVKGGRILQLQAQAALAL